MTIPKRKKAVPLKKAVNKINNAKKNKSAFSKHPIKLGQIELDDMTLTNSILINNILE